MNGLRVYVATVSELPTLVEADLPGTQTALALLRHTAASRVVHMLRCVETREASGYVSAVEAILAEARTTLGLPELTELQAELMGAPVR